MTARSVVRKLMPGISSVKRWIANKGAKAPESYSQAYEDVLIERIAGWFNISISSYVDVGAYHPCELSNTYRFYLAGARGVVVDPNPQLQALYRKYRADDLFLNAAIGAEQSGRVTYFVIDPDTLSGTDRASAEQAQRFGHRLVAEIDVPVLALSSVIAQCSRSGVVDFLSVDVEGAEDKVLDSNDWGVFRPKIVCLETIIYDPVSPRKKRWDLVEKMTSYGYVRVAETWINSIFVSTECFGSARHLNELRINEAQDDSRL